MSKNSEGEIFVFWPADLQYLPEDIPKLIQKMNQMIYEWIFSAHSRMMGALL